MQFALLSGCKSRFFAYFYLSFSPPDQWIYARAAPVLIASESYLESDTDCFGDLLSVYADPLIEAAQMYQVNATTFCEFELMNLICTVRQARLDPLGMTNLSYP